MVPGFLKYFTTFPSQAAECLRCRFAPWSGGETPRLCRTLTHVRAGGFAGTFPALRNARSRHAWGATPPPLPKARGRLGPCGHAPAECLRCQFAPWGGELTLAPDREVNARPRSVTGLDDSRLGQLANARAHQAVRAAGFVGTFPLSHLKPGGNGFCAVPIGGHPSPFFVYGKAGALVPGGHRPAPTEPAGETCAPLQPPAGLGVSPQTPQVF